LHAKTHTKAQRASNPHSVHRIAALPSPSHRAVADARSARLADRSLKLEVTRQTPPRGHRLTLGNARTEAKFPGPWTLSKHPLTSISRRHNMLGLWTHTFGHFLILSGIRKSAFSSSRNGSVFSPRSIDPDNPLTTVQVQGIPYLYSRTKRMQPPPARTAPPAPRTIRVRATRGRRGRPSRWRARVSSRFSQPRPHPARSAPRGSDARGRE